MNAHPQQLTKINENKSYFHTHTHSLRRTAGRSRDPRLSAPLPLRELQQHQVTVGIVAATTMRTAQMWVQSPRAGAERNLVFGTYAGIGTLEEVKVERRALRLWVVHQLRVGRIGFGFSSVRKGCGCLRSDRSCGLIRAPWQYQTVCSSGSVSLGLRIIRQGRDVS